MATGPKTLELISEEIEKRLQRMGMPTEKTPFSVERIMATAVTLLMTGGAVAGTNIYNGGEVSAARAAAEQAKVERDSARSERTEMRESHAHELTKQREHHSALTSQQTEACRDFMRRCEDLCK